MTEYTLLFNAITDSPAALEKLSEELKTAQREAEELFVSRPE